MYLFSIDGVICRPSHGTVGWHGPRFEPGMGGLEAGTLTTRPTHHHTSFNGLIVGEGQVQGERERHCLEDQAYGRNERVSGKFVRLISSAAYPGRVESS